MPYSNSPLRYPGGKSRLSNFMKLMLKMNNLENGTYVEPYAGGAGIAIALLLEGYVRKIVINDLDSSVHAFWHSVLHENRDLIHKIEEV